MKRMLFLCSFACIFLLSGCSFLRQGPTYTTEEAEELQDVHNEKRNADALEESESSEETEMPASAHTK